MATPIYLRKSGDDRVKLHAVVDVSQETGSRLQFQSKNYLSVDSQSHYYITQRSANQSLELWLIELHCTDPEQQPYAYTAVISRKYRDVPEGWIQDE